MQYLESVQNTIIQSYYIWCIYKPQISNQSSCHMMLLLSGVGVEVVSVSLVLKESQSDAVELKPWMTISDLYGRLTVKFIHAYSVND